MGDSSDEDDLDVGKLRFTSEDKLYDPQADDETAKWVDRELRPHLAFMKGNEEVKMDEQAEAKEREKGVAHLSCPLCFTSVCMDYQQHVRRKSQFRAIFVQNCRIGKPVPQDQTLLQVHCDRCSAELGVMDEEEVPLFAQS